MHPGRLLVLIAGLFVVGATLGSAIRVAVLPRPVPVRISRRVFYSTRLLFKLRMLRTTRYESRDRIMSAYGPVSLFALLFTWLALIAGGFTAAFWGAGAASMREAFTLSGSSLLTLGFASRPDLPTTSLAFAEATLGLVILALLITYLPTIYATFSRREQQVATLEVAAGYPPSAAVMIQRFTYIGWWDRSTELWRDWERWFIDVEETHTSFPALAFFRSQQPYHSWVTAAGTILDTAALAASTLDRPRDADAELMLRAGFVALRRIATFFNIPFNDSPKPIDPISIDRAEYDAVVATLEAGGVPLKADREQAWRDFAGWRVNYDTVLIELCALVMAPPATWSSDRLAKGGRKSGPGDHYVRSRSGKVKTLIGTTSPDLPESPIKRHGS